MGLFVLGGTWYSHDRSDYIRAEHGFDWTRQEREMQLEKQLSLGTGLGIERSIAGVLQVNFDIGYRFRAHTAPSGRYSLGLGTGIGIGYRF